MQVSPPRIAFFPDSFHEVNGVAHTARNFVEFARRRQIPMLCVCAGPHSRTTVQGSVTVMELERGPWSVRIEQDLSFDPFFFRHAQAISAALKVFRPDVVHITGPSELGMLGAIFARRRRLSLAASWHTNVHEYAGRRFAARLQSFGSRQEHAEGRRVEAGALAVVARFYKLAQVLYAPNPTLCELLRRKTGRPCHLMQRGVDTELFSPERRRDGGRVPLVLGYVGRLSVEKNVAALPRIHQQLKGHGLAAQWLIVGHGAEERQLRRLLGEAAMFTGVLRGEALADAYASMDLLVFPSHTDTFGNVVLEALASGTPAIVTPDGGPAHIVQNGITGCVADDEGFPAAILRLWEAPEALAEMRRAARRYALTCSWDAVFEGVLAAYPAV